MAAPVAPAPFPDSSTTILSVSESAADLPTDKPPIENVAPLPPAPVPSVVNVPFSPLYAKIHKLNIAIGLLLCIRIAILGILFIPWSLKTFQEYPVGYEPDYLFFETLDLEGLIIPHELRRESLLRYGLATLNAIDLLVCLSTSGVSFCTKDLSWIILLCVFWLCFMLLSLCIYSYGVILFVLNSRFETILYLHPVFIAGIMVLLIFNILWLRKLTKLGITSVPSVPAVNPKNMKNKDPSASTKPSKDPNMIQGKNPQSQHSLKPTLSDIDNAAMFKNIFSDTEPSTQPSAMSTLETTSTPNQFQQTGNASNTFPQTGFVQNTFPQGGSTPNQFQQGGNAQNIFSQGGNVPNTFPQGGSAPNQFPQGGSAPNQFPQGGSAPNQFPQGGSSPNQFPQGGSAPNQFLQGGSAPNQFPQGGNPQNTFPQTGNVLNTATQGAASNLLTTSTSGVSTAVTPSPSPQPSMFNFGSNQNPATTAQDPRGTYTSAPYQTNYNYQQGQARANPYGSAQNQNRPPNFQLARQPSLSPILKSTPVTEQTTESPNPSTPQIVKTKKKEKRKEKEKERKKDKEKERDRDDEKEKEREKKKSKKSKKKEKRKSRKSKH